MTTTKTKTKKPKSLWETLSQIDCSEHIEKKGGFNYLSWAWAWGMLMEHCPDATFENHLNADGYPCFFDRDGDAMVRVTLSVGEHSHTEDFPVLNYKNQSIQNPDSYAVNTALKRCLVKSMAYFGLGHYIYAGEDLPPQEVVPFNRDEAVAAIFAHIESNAESDWDEKVLAHYHCDSVEKLRDDEIEFIMKRIKTSNKEKN